MYWYELGVLITDHGSQPLDTVLIEEIRDQHAGRCNVSSFRRLVVRVPLYLELVGVKDHIRKVKQ